jgi:DNA-directed RNA polymerase II subunit RPB1
LGIEAARQVLYDEISKVIEFDGSYVDYRHTAMLIDTMTYKGSLMAITRHGMNRTETGVLMRCSFEETVNVITDAAMFAEYNPICGVTENIIMGKMACLGTGTMNVMIDPEKFMRYFDTQDHFVPSSPVRYHDFEDSFFPE